MRVLMGMQVATLWNTLGNLTFITFALINLKIFKYGYCATGQRKVQVD